MLFHMPLITSPATFLLATAIADVAFIGGPPLIRKSVKKTWQSTLRCSMIYLKNTIQL
jgi:hypothetical protein